MTSERRGRGKLVGRLGEARLKVADVLMLMMMKVKDVLVQMEARQVAVMMMKVVKVTVLLEVKMFVASVFSLLSPLTRTQTTLPQTRLAARTSR